MEFLRRPKNATAANVASARDFTQGDLGPFLSKQEIEDRINDQVCHLRYERESFDKMDENTMVHVRSSVHRAMAQFEAALSPEAREFWQARTVLSIGVLTLSVTTTSISTIAVGSLAKT